MDLGASLVRRASAKGPPAVSPPGYCCGWSEWIVRGACAGGAGQQPPMALLQLHLGSRRGQLRDPSYIILMSVLDTVSLNINL
jgi:hypothetical protein